MFDRLAEIEALVKSKAFLAKRIQDATIHVTVELWSHGGKAGRGGRDACWLLFVGVHHDDGRMETAECDSAEAVIDFLRTGTVPTRGVTDKPHILTNKELFGRRRCRWSSK